MASGKVSVPVVFVSAALVIVTATQAWALNQIFEHSKDISDMKGGERVRSEYETREWAETKAWMRRIEDKIDAMQAAKGGD